MISLHGSGATGSERAAVTGYDGCPQPVDAEEGTAVHGLTVAGCADGTEVVFVGIEGAGHPWPSGLFSLPAELVGAISAHFDASDTSGLFFASHGR